jgi:hypothetical protein
MLVAQLLFTLLEVARYRESAKVLQMSTDRGLESEFADYCSPLWDKYHILGMSAADGEGNFSFREREASIRGQSVDSLAGVDFLTAGVEDVEFSEYQLLTDMGGKVFEKAVCSYMKQNIGYEAAKAIYSTYESVKDVVENYDSDDAMQNAQDALKESAKETSFTGKAAGGTVITLTARKAAGNILAATPTDSSGDSVQNPITAVAKAKEKGVVGLVLKNSSKISSNSLTLSGTVSHRTLTKGTKTSDTQGSWYQTVLFDQYLETYLSCYTDTKKDRGLNYELEYLIGGKSSDKENLRLVVKELLALREPLNMASITASSERESEALSLATAIAGITANPVIIEAVKYGIIAAWAFVESVLDVRTLLSGGKIDLIKSDSDWTSNVNSLPQLLSGWSTAKSSKSGLTYRQYLGKLLFVHSGDKLAMRAMDVIEAAIRLEEGYKSFKMDHVVCETQLDVTYDYNPLFMSFVYLLDSKPDMFRIQRTSSYSYLSGKEGT